MLPPNAKAVRCLLRSVAPDRHHLAPAAFPREEGDVRARQTECRSEEMEEGGIRGPIDGRCGDPDAQLGAMEAGDLVSGGTRLHPNGDAGAGAVRAKGRQ